MTVAQVADNLGAFTPADGVSFAVYRQSGYDTDTSPGAIIGGVVVSLVVVCAVCGCIYCCVRSAAKKGIEAAQKNQFSQSQGSYYQNQFPPPPSVYTPPPPPPGSAPMQPPQPPPPSVYTPTPPPPGSAPMQPPPPPPPPSGYPANMKSEPFTGAALPADSNTSMAASNTASLPSPLDERAQLREINTK